MGQTEKKRPIELLRAANKGRIKNIRIELPPFEAYMSIPDIFMIVRERKKVEKIRYVEYRREGLDQEPIIQEDWDKYLAESIKTQRINAEKVGKTFNEAETIANIEKEKPDNLARQLAIDDSNIEMIMEILPKMIKREDGTTPLFETAEDRKGFQEIVRSDPKMFEYLAQKVTEAFALWSKTEEEVKNSSTAGSLSNGKSRNSSQDDTPDMGLPLVES